MDFLQYSLKPMFRAVHLKDETLMTLTKDFDDMYLKQLNTFASQDEVDEEL